MCEPDVDALLRRMSSKKIAEWQAFWELEPFGDEWRQAGTVAAAALSPHVEKGRKVTAENFIPKPSEPEEQSEGKTPEQILGMFQTFASMTAR